MSTPTNTAVRAVVASDAAWLRERLRALWGGDTVVAHDTVYTPYELPGFVAEDGSGPVGVVTYRLDEAECEVVTIDSFREGEGIGTRLLEAVVGQARSEGCRRVWLVTTNDNLRALRFYQRRGFRLVGVDRGAVERARRLKPTIPLAGNDGIPIRDEIELEHVLVEGRSFEAP